WEAMASFWVYTPQAAETFMKEWMEVINRDYNHPSIIVWGMLNESWGTPQIYDNSQQQDFSKSLYYMVKSIDSTRLVISNDGWEMTVGDICAIHSYKHGEKEDKRQHEVFAQSLKSLKTLANIVDKNLFAKGSEYKNQPVVLTECGGISLKEKAADSQEEQNWGYTTIKKEEFIEEYDR
ncbi:glycoside hydrolase family 2, partial [Soehngenia saccharolytica]